MFRWFNNLKLTVKLFFILLIVLLLMLCGTAVQTRINTRERNNTLYKQTVQLLTLLSQSIQNKLDGVAKDSFVILADNVLQDSLTTMRLCTYGSEEWLAAKKVINNRLMNISLLHTDISSIYLRTAGGIPFTRVDSRTDIPLDALDGWAEKAREAEGREVWMPGEENANAVFLVRDIREIADLTLNSIALLVMRVNLEKIVSECCDPLIQMDIPLFCSIDLDGAQIYTNNEKLVDMEIPQEHFTLRKVGDETFFCVRYAQEKSRWAYSVAISYESIIRSQRSASLMIAVISVLTLSAALVFGCLLIKSILRHFDRLILKYNAYAHGEIISDEKHYRDRQDEIGELHRQFDRMVSDHQQMIEENYVKQQRLLEAQVRQLRAQIHPHFLFNTLESIYCLAKTNGDTRIAVMTSSLGRMLRAALKDARDIITIGEDLEICRQYINIQKIRFENHLKADFRIEVRYLDLPIPAMTIQPLLENAIRYAAEELLDECVIRVYCEPRDHYVDLVVEDNGPGMAENILEKLESGELKPEGLGIGLSNIHTRLRLAFKDQACGLTIQRKMGKTRVVVRLPGRVNNDQAAAG